MGLVAEGQLRGRGGGFVGNEERDEEGHDHGARPEQEGRSGDERLLRETRTERSVWFGFYSATVKMRSSPPWGRAAAAGRC